MNNNIEIREIEAGDTEIITSVFQAVGWNKSEHQFCNYHKEQDEGKRVVLVAFFKGDFAGYGNIIRTQYYGDIRDLKSQ